MTTFGTKLNFGRAATIVVAASDSAHASDADYVCPGTDDLDYITTTVIPALPSNEGKIILLEGTYNCNTAAKPLKVDGTYNLIIEGQGTGTELKIVGNVASYLIHIESCASTGRIEIRDMMLTGAGAATSGACIYLTDDTYNTYISGVTFSDAKDTGVFIYGAYNTHISDCDFMITTSGSRHINGTYAKGYNSIDACYFYGNNTTYAAAYVYGGSWTVTNCSFNSVTRGIEALTTTVVVSGCSFNQGAGYSIYDDGGSSFTISSCLFNLAYSNPQIYFNGTYLAVSACMFYAPGSTSPSIYLGANASYAAITGNLIQAYYASPFVGSYGNSVRGIVADNFFVSGAINGGYMDQPSMAATSGDLRYYENTTDSFLDVAASNSGAIDTVVLTSGMPVAITLAAEDQPDVPRNLDLTLRDADTSISGITISVTGYDAQGVFRTDTYTTASGAQSRAWSTLVSASVTAVYGESSGDVLYVGYGQKLGLSYRVSASSDVYRVTLDGTPITTSGYFVNALYDTVEISGLAIGSDVIVKYRKDRNYRYKE